MKAAAEPLAGVADWTWSVDPALRIVSLSASAALAFGQAPGHLLRRALAEAGRLGVISGAIFDNTPIDLPGGRFYLSATSVEADGGQSGIATREPLPPRGENGGPDRAVARRIQPAVLRLAGLADRLATDFASGEDRYASYSADLVSATEHLRSLVSERGGEGRRIVELDVLAVRACGMVLIRAKERGIVLQAPAGSPLRAFGDERATLQVLANLLTNAIKYTPGGGRVGVDVESASDDLVKATVWDTGPGIPASDQARIFESFERLEDSGDDGAGLGLGISQRLARAMGGEIRIESSDARGTRVALLLPAA